MYRLKPVGLNSMNQGGNDAIIAVIPVPAGGTFEGIKFNLHAVSTTKTEVLKEVSGYALSIHMFPILDPDSAWVPITVWNQQLPKDDQFAASGLDIDTTGLDTTPFIEWGDAAPSLLAGHPTFATPIYKAARLISFAKSKGGFEIDGVVATEDGYIPTDFWSRGIGRSKTAPVHSAVMVGISGYNWPTPKTDFTDMLPDSTLDWDILTYADDYQVDARKALVGGIATGTQEVAAESLAFLNAYIETNVEKNAGHFHPCNWELTFEYQASVLVPGTVRVQELNSGQPIS